MCKGFASVDSRNASEIRMVLDSHRWVSMSSDKTPVGLISRFTCSQCGDEYVAMLTSPSAMQVEQMLGRDLEVSANNVLV
jgi:hypothetical protein